MTGEPIVGLATAQGEGGVAIVRVSGEGAEKLLERAFAPAKQRPPFESHRLMYGHVLDASGNVIDEAMGVLMRAPSTYTREDVAEIHTHGGDAAATMVIRRLCELGARPAEAGEFTRRAFLNGRIDLAQAEAVMGVIGARSAAALRSETALLAGGASRFIKQAQEKLLKLLAGVQAHIDYPDEIDEAEATADLSTGLDELIAMLENASDERAARILRNGLRVALCGCPNAGKSTLFNALLGEERAIVTDVPGTTRDVLQGTFALNGLNVTLLDTAGLRDSDDTVERIGVSRARSAIANADAALLLIDASTPLNAEETALLHEPMPCPCAVLLNKEDVRAAVTAEAIAAETALFPILTISAGTGAGLNAVRAFLTENAKLPSEDMLTHERHLAAAKQTVTHLRQAKHAIESGLPLDLADVDLHEALWTLGRITGESVDDRLLDEIFAGFCVGK